MSSKSEARAELIEKIRKKDSRGEVISFQEKQALFSPNHADQILKQQKQQRHWNHGGASLGGRDPCFKMKSQMTHKKRRSKGKQSTLTAGSVGSNVVIFYGEQELIKVHYAVLIVRWSKVAALEVAARKGIQTNGLMHVHVDDLLLSSASASSLTKTLGHLETNETVQMENSSTSDESCADEKLFPEDFQSIFQDIFLTHFIPLIHNQFNISKNKGAARTVLESGPHQTTVQLGDEPATTTLEAEESLVSSLISLQLPNDVIICFKLLVMSERLKARLKQPIFKHILTLIQKDYSAEGVKSCSGVVSESNSFRLLKTFILIVKVTPEHQSLQAHVINEAIRFLVSIIPVSLATIEDLVYLSTSHFKPTIAVQLFQQSTSFFLTVSSKSNAQRGQLSSVEYRGMQQQAMSYVAELKKKLETQRSNNERHDGTTLNAFKDFKLRLDAYKARVYRELSSRVGHSEKKLVFSALGHGIIVEKFGTGLVCIWCAEGMFNWMRLDKLRKQRDGFWIPYTEQLQNKSILGASFKPNAAMALFKKREQQVRSQHRARGGTANGHQHLEASSEPPQSPRFTPKKRSKTKTRLEMLDFLNYLQKSTQGKIAREDILSITPNKADPFEASFRIKYVEQRNSASTLGSPIGVSHGIPKRRIEKDLIFRTKNKTSCDIYVEIFNKWFLNHLETTEQRKHVDVIHPDEQMGRGGRSRLPFHRADLPFHSPAVDTDGNATYFSLDQDGGRLSEVSGEELVHGTAPEDDSRSQDPRMSQTQTPRSMRHFQYLHPSKLKKRHTYMGFPEDHAAGHYSRAEYQRGFQTQEAAIADQQDYSPARPKTLPPTNIRSKSRIKNVVKTINRLQRYRSSSAASNQEDATKIYPHNHQTADREEQMLPYDTVGKQRSNFI